MDPWDYLEPRYTLRQAATAAAFPLNTLRSNYQRGWFQSFGDGMAVGRGRAQRLCLGDILVLAIASRLIDVGLRPQQAYNAARPFGMSAKTPKGIPRRMPFQLFDRAAFETLFIWRAGRAPDLIPVSREAGVTLEELGVTDPFGEPALILPLSAVEVTVCRRLGLNVESVS